MSTADPARPALRIEGVEFRYRHTRDAFVVRGLDLSVRRGETVVLMGHNGSGKTTVLRLAAGLVRPARGRVVVGLNGHEQVLQAPHREIGYIPQQLGLLRHRSVLHNVLLGALGRVGTLASLWGRFPTAEVDAAHRWIDRVGLAPKATWKVHRLSGGERQRVAIARALMQHPRLLLADEFVSNLDPRRAREVLEVAREGLHEQRITSLMALHNLDLARRVGDRIIFLRQGAVAADLPATEVTAEVAE
jgi:phosphonate transport system ATP-binding protein